MKKSLFLLSLPLLLAANLSFADEEDRYRAIVLQQGGGTENRAKVFIIDSEDGHLWTWEDKTKFTTKDGRIAFGTLLTYQGKVRAGKEAGEVVEQGLGR